MNSMFTSLPCLLLRKQAFSAKLRCLHDFLRETDLPVLSLLFETANAALPIADQLIKDAADGTANKLR